ncbi:hypothetical protein ACFQ4C_09555 [Larkinella insperata]|uniref:Secreted protein n=1 Tax=Larkinella insperata TaxID=332158 RepID=A0ABW3QDF1_9BACT|nr:hypothetical protein [Larkinella insperata]
MKTIRMTVATLVTVLAITLQTSAQTTTSEGNAANTAQSRNGNVKEQQPASGQTRAKVERKVTGSRPDVNSASDKTDKYREDNMPNREKRSTVTSDADGKKSVVRGRPKADPKTKQKRGEGRSFGNTGPN